MKIKYAHKKYFAFRISHSKILVEQLSMSAVIEQNDSLLFHLVRFVRNFFY